MNGEAKGVWLATMLSMSTECLVAMIHGLDAVSGHRLVAVRCETKCHLDYL